MRITSTNINVIPVQSANRDIATAPAAKNTWVHTEPTCREAIEQTWIQGLKAPTQTKPARRISRTAWHIASTVSAVACILSVMRGAKADGLLMAAGAHSYPYMGFDANGTSYGVNILVSVDTRDGDINSKQVDTLMKNIATCTSYTQVATQSLNVLLGSSGILPNAALLFTSKVDSTDAVQTCIRKFVGLPVAH